MISGHRHSQIQGLTAPSPPPAWSVWSPSPQGDAGRRRETWEPAAAAPGPSLTQCEDAFRPVSDQHHRETVIVFISIIADWETE